jgi:hypothetical protein
MKSNFLSLNSKDFIKGLLVSVLTSVITIVYTSLQAGSFTFDWKAIAMAALTSALAYITKNLLTNSEDQVFKAEPKA